MNASGSVNLGAEAELDRLAADIASIAVAAADLASLASNASLAVTADYLHSLSLAASNLRDLSVATAARAKALARPVTTVAIAAPGTPNWNELFGTDGEYDEHVINYSGADRRDDDEMGEMGDSDEDPPYDD